MIKFTKLPQPTGEESTYKLSGADQYFNIGRDKDAVTLTMFLTKADCRELMRQMVYEGFERKGGDMSETVNLHLINGLKVGHDNPRDAIDERDEKVEGLNIKLSWANDQIRFFRKKLEEINPDWDDYSFDAVIPLTPYPGDNEQIIFEKDAAIGKLNSEIDRLTKQVNYLSRPNATDAVNRLNGLPSSLTDEELVCEYNKVKSEDDAAELGRS